MRVFGYGIAIALIGATTISAGSAQTVAFTTFTSSYGFNTNNQGIALTGPSNLNPESAAYQFTSAASGQLTQVTVPVQYVSDNTTLSFSLMTDQGNQMGSVLASWSFTNSNLNYHLQTFQNSNPSVQLQAGNLYWIVGNASGAGSHNWGQSSLPGLMYGALAFGDGVFHYGNTDLFPAFEVQVQPVPEPASFAALALGGLLLRKRRRK